MMSQFVTLSIVSHGQAALIHSLIEDLNRLNLSNVEIIITINIPEDESLIGKINYPHFILRNSSPMGFGANHNAAFEHSNGNFFVVLNPDIRIPDLSIHDLISPMDNDQVGAVAPVIVNPIGAIEDNVRRFPTFFELFKRAILKTKICHYQWGCSPINVDWAAGMFVLFRREAFASVGGFDDKRYFMYFEDVDICQRLLHSGWKTLLQPKCKIIHDARRASRTNIKHFIWHLSSAIRYLTGF